MLEQENPRYGKETWLNLVALFSGSAPLNLPTTNRCYRLLYAGIMSLKIRIMAVYGYNTAQQMFSFMILYQSLVIICYILPVLDVL